jgi:integrase
LLPVVDPNVTVKDYSARWLQLCGNLKPRSLSGYREKLNNHLLPALGSIRVRKLHRSQIKTLLAEKKAAGLAVDTVRLIHGTLRAMLNAAVEDAVIQTNPAAGLGRSMRLTRSKADRQENIRAMDREHLARFLAAVEAKTPRYYPLFFVMSRTGMRLGEALALKWDDLDVQKRELRVERALTTTGETGTPKSGHGRTVDLGASSCEVLRRLRAGATEGALKRGERLGPWVWPGEDGEPMPHVTAEAAFKRALKAAGLPGHFSPHSLRHSYASLLLADGVSPAYVQEQLGHASIELTVGTYGRWLRKKAPGAVDRLDRVVAREAEVVAGSPSMDGVPDESDGPKATEDQLLGGEGGIRTPGTGISPYNRLAICPVQPLQHLSTTIYGRVFEP